MDTHTPEQRARNMSRIRSKDTAPELRLRKSLWASGLRYRIHYTLPGKPDIVFVSARVAVFVDGCFWHRCPLHGVLPKSNADYWRKKLNNNVRRDREVDAKLASMDWKVLRFWEHEVNDDVQAVVADIQKQLGGTPNAP